MPYFFFQWTDNAVEHLAENGVLPEEFEEVVCDPVRIEVSRTSGKPIAFGTTSDGRRLACVYEYLDSETILPITAFEPDLR